jgi:hypothetical protein
MNEKLQEAVALYKKGDKTQASRLLAEIVRQEPNNSVAWYGLSLCLADPDKKIYCLKRVVNLDPTHKKAQQLLEQLEGNERISNVQKAFTDAPEDPVKKVSSSRWVTLSIVGVGGIILICAVVGLILANNTNIFQPPPTLVPTRIQPTYTPAIRLYNEEAITYLERITQMPNEFQINSASDMRGNVLDDNNTTQIATVASRTFVNPTYSPDEISGVMYSLFVFDDIEEAKTAYDEEVQRLSSSKPYTGQFDEGAYKIGIYDESTHLIYIDKIIRKSNVVAEIYCLATLSKNTDPVELTAWSLYYENLMLESIR